MSPLERRPLAMILAVLALVAPAAAHQGDGYVPHRGDDDWTTAIHGTIRHSGGWGWATPVIRLGGEAVLGDHPTGGFTAMGRTLGSPKFWGGMLGTFAGTYAATAVSGLIPGGPLLKTGIWILGGFVGWEIGTGSIGSTDWLSLLSQTAVSALVYRGVQLLMKNPALFRGGPVATLAAIASAIATGILLDVVRNRKLEDPLASGNGTGKGVRLLEVQQFAGES